MIMNSVLKLNLFEYISDHHKIEYKLKINNGK